MLRLTFNVRVKKPHWCQVFPKIKTIQPSDSIVSVSTQETIKMVLVVVKTSGNCEDFQFRFCIVADVDTRTDLLFVNLYIACLANLAKQCSCVYSGVVNELRGIEYDGGSRGRVL